MQETLKLKDDIEIAQITRADILLHTERFGDFQSRILACDDSYPNIREWFYKRVIPGVLSTQRAAFLGYRNGMPIATAIVKIEQRAKFCHLKIDEAYQYQHLGEIFFTLMAVEARRLAKEVHFSLPESLWENQRKFFNSFGFQDIVGSDFRYRPSERELYCSAAFDGVWDSIQEKLPKLVSVFSIDMPSLEKTLLLSIKPDFGRLFLEGKKNIDIRKRFNAKWIGYRAIFYETKPSQKLIGEAVIAGVHCGAPMSIWEEFKWQVGCSKEDYLEYVGSADPVYAIEMEDFTPYYVDVSIAYMNALAGTTLRPPQSYFEVNLQSKWLNPVSLLSLIQKPRPAEHAAPAECIGSSKE